MYRFKHWGQYALIVSSMQLKGWRDTRTDDDVDQNIATSGAKKPL
jgi:hypothetical protein